MGPHLTGAVCTSLLGAYFWWDSRALDLLRAIPVAVIAWFLRPSDWRDKAMDLFS